MSRAKAKQLLNIYRSHANCVDTLTICGIPPKNVQSLRIYGVASHKTGHKETLWDVF